MTFDEAYELEEWQICRQAIVERDKSTCRACHTVTTSPHVHHGYYLKGAMPWEYPYDTLFTLCETCHRAETYRICMLKEAIGKLEPREDGLFIRLLSRFVDALCDMQQQDKTSMIIALEDVEP